MTDCGDYPAPCNCAATHEGFQMTVGRLRSALEDVPDDVLVSMMVWDGAGDKHFVSAVEITFDYDEGVVEVVVG